jgi:hypothetical protein
MNKTGRVKCLADFIKGNSLDFVGIQETKKNNFSDGLLETISRNMCWNFIPARGGGGSRRHFGRLENCLFLHNWLPKLSVWGSSYD